MNQAVVQGGRVEIYNRTSGCRTITSGYGGNSGNGRATSGIVTNAWNSQRKVETVDTGNSKTTGTTLHCYNCKKQGHLANACPEPRTRGGDYYKHVMLLAYKDEAGGNLNDTQQGFMENTLSDDEYEDLQANAVVVSMANVQEHHISETENGPLYDTNGLSQVPDSEICLINDIVSVSAHDEQQSVQTTSLSTLNDDNQINLVVTFDDQSENDNNDSV